MSSCKKESFRVYMCVCVFTSDNGQLCSDGDVSLAVACHTLVDVLVSGSSEGLDPQHGPSTFIKLYGLDSDRINRVIYIRHSRVSI